MRHVPNERLHIRHRRTKVDMVTHFNELVTGEGKTLWNFIFEILREKRYKKPGNFSGSDLRKFAQEYFQMPTKNELQQLYSAELCRLSNESADAVSLLQSCKRSVTTVVLWAADRNSYKSYTYFTFGLLSVLGRYSSCIRLKISTHNVQYQYYSD